MVGEDQQSGGTNWGQGMAGQGQSWKLISGMQR